MQIPASCLDRDLSRRILEAAGLLWREGDEGRLLRVLGPRLLAQGFSCAEEYACCISGDGVEGRREREWLTSQFSTGETYFMRDQGLFELLSTRILPELLANRPPGRPLRIWSAGCASGEEAYSLAMLVDQLGYPPGAGQVQIVGSDINEAAIARAQAGIYGQWSFRCLDAERRARYFRPFNGDQQISEHLRAAVRFEHRDLLGGAAEPGLFDLILCRNVFIYLSRPAIEHIIARLTAALDAGAYFIPGHGELVGFSLPGLDSVAHAAALLYRRPFAANPPPRHPAAELPAAVKKRPPRRLVPRVPDVTSIAPPHSLAVAVADVDVDTLLAQAWRDADRGATPLAQDACERALRLSPFEPRAYYLLAQLAQEREAFDEARTLLHKVLYLDPCFIAAQLNLADLSARCGDAQGARRIRERARRELLLMPPDTVLSAPAPITAGVLLQELAEERCR